MSSTFKRPRNVVGVGVKPTLDVVTATITTTDPQQQQPPTSTTTSSSNSTHDDPKPNNNYVTTSIMKGTKFWTHGMVLTSTGLRELDSILLSSSSAGNTSTSSSSNSNSNSSIGGQPMGTCICLENNDSLLSWSSPLSSCMIRYWCAEGISQEQTLIIPVFNESKVNPDHHELLGEIPPWTTIDNNDARVTPTTTITSTTNTIQELLDSLPRNNNLDIQERTELLSTGSSSGGNVSAVTNSNKSVQQPLETLAEGADDENDGDGDKDDDDDDYYDDVDASTTNNTGGPTQPKIDTDEGLVVAWQYRKDIQQERLGLTHPQLRSSSTDAIAGRDKMGKNRTQGRHGSSSTVYCHSYNLHGRLNDQLNIDPYVRIVPITTMDKNDVTRSSSNSRIVDGMKFYQQLISLIATSTKSRTVVRLLLYYPDMTLCAFALPLLLHYIRKHKLPVIVLVIPQNSSSMATTTMSNLYHIRRCSDVVLSTESFALRNSDSYPPPTEFRNLHGLLHIVRLSTMTQMSTAGHFADRTIQRTPISIRYGLYRDRRKLHISLLHIPPEDYTTDGGSVTNGAVRSGAGRRTNTTTATIGCGSSGGDGKGPLDF